MTSKERTGRNEDSRKPEPYVVRVSGEMDHDHAEQLSALLTAAVDETPEGADIIVDLRNSSFCDSSGLSVLLAARQQAQEARHHLVLAAPSHQLVRVLELTESADLFTLAPIAG
ncbi:STAS domain-containing protein [Streptomyces sp. NPDC127112]|uniref:STAS domain-containing protein n=1 Tax=Streptomyces sp. NPDC127112 TaxID=3345364 RepID=UPI00362B4BD5